MTNPRITIPLVLRRSPAGMWGMLALGAAFIGMYIGIIWYDPLQSDWIAILLALGILSLAVGLGYRSQFVVSSEGIAHRGVFGQSRFLRWDDIEVATVGSVQLVLVSRDGAKLSVPHFMPGYCELLEIVSRAQPAARASDGRGVYESRKGLWIWACVVIVLVASGSFIEIRTDSSEGVGYILVGLGAIAAVAALFSPYRLTIVNDTVIFQSLVRKEEYGHDEVTALEWVTESVGDGVDVTTLVLRMRDGSSPRVDGFGNAFAIYSELRKWRRKHRRRSAIDRSRS